MQTYSNNCTSAMPLMMNFTMPTPIEETDPVIIHYNDKDQITIEMRIVGTRSMRSHITRKSHGSTRDKKNEIDDSKSVR